MPYICNKIVNYWQRSIDSLSLFSDALSSTNIFLSFYLENIQTCRKVEKIIHWQLRNSLYNFRFCHNCLILFSYSLSLCTHNVYTQYVLHWTICTLQTSQYSITKYFSTHFPRKRTFLYAATIPWPGPRKSLKPLLIPDLKPQLPSLLLLWGNST